MDAVKLAAVITAGGGLLLSGCTLFDGPRGAANGPADAPPDAEPPILVEETKPTAVEPAEDELEAHVAAYLEWLSQSAQERRSERRRAENVPPATQPAAMDGAAEPVMQVAASEQVAEAPVSVKVEQVEPAAASAMDGEMGAAETPQPPKLVSVAVQPEPKVEEVTPGLVQSPEANSPAAVAGPLSLREFVERRPGLTKDASFREQLDERVLHLLAGDLEGARRPLEMATDEQQTLAGAYLEALAALREAHQGNPAGREEALRKLRELSERLDRVSELRVPVLAICREVRGFGQYTPIEPARFPSGVASEFIAYCELSGFASVEEEGRFVARFQLRTTVMTPGGGTVVEIEDPDIVDRCRTRRRDCFIPRIVRLPATLSPGEYVVKVTVIDKLGEKVTESRATLRVVART